MSFFVHRDRRIHLTRERPDGGYCLILAITRRWSDKERPSNLLCCQAADFTQGERNRPFRWQSGMAAGADETEAVVLMIVLLWRLVRAGFKLECEIPLCGVEACTPAYPVNSPEVSR